MHQEKRPGGAPVEVVDGDAEGPLVDVLPPVHHALDRREVVPCGGLARRGGRGLGTNGGCPMIGCATSKRGMERDSTDA